MSEISSNIKAYVEQGGTCFICGKPWVYDEFVRLYYCEECDSILSKLPSGRAYMLLGDTGTGKSVLLNKILDLHLKNRRPCVYVAFDEDPSQLREFMGKYARNLGEHEKNGLMTFFDCFTCTAGIPSGEKYSIKTPGDLNDLNLKLMSLQNELVSIGPPVVCIDSLTKAFIYCDPDMVLKFIAGLTAKLKTKKGSAFFTAGLGTVSSEVQKRLEQMADGLIELRIRESEGRTSRQFRVSKVRGVLYYENWLPFFVGKSSIFLSVPTDSEELRRFNEILKMISEV